MVPVVRPCAASESRRALRVRVPGKLSVLGVFKAQSSSLANIATKLAVRAAPCIRQPFRELSACGSKPPLNLQHWRGVSAIFALKGAWMLVFHNLLAENLQPATSRPYLRGYLFRRK